MKRVYAHHPPPLFFILLYPAWNPYQPLSPNPTSLIYMYFFILYSSRLEHLISDSVFHLHLHQDTHATVANLLRFAGLISYWSLTHPTPLTQIYLGWNHSDLKNNLTYQIYRYWLFFNKFKALFIYLILIYLLIHLFIYSCDHNWWQELKELKVNPLHKTVLFHSH